MGVVSDFREQCVPVLEVDQILPCDFRSDSGCVDERAFVVDDIPFGNFAKWGVNIFHCIPS